MASPDAPGNPPPYTYGPPPPGGPPPSTTIIHTNMTPVIPVVVSMQMGRLPQIIVCRSCNAQIETRVIHKATTRTHLFAALLCVLGCWPCVCIPYCMQSCQNTDHYCPSCNAYIGSYIN